jgi:uncharacterized protein YndB with AHSA1/START domain
MLPNANGDAEVCELGPLEGASGAGISYSHAGGVDDVTHQDAIINVQKSVRLRIAPARAFAIFTTRMGRWFPNRGTSNRQLILEPRAGGRWLERGPDGSECAWGEVLAWEPPARVKLAWRITSQLRFDAALHTELEIRFVPKDSGSIVTLEHRLEGYGHEALDMRVVLDGCWQALLDSFATYASGSMVTRAHPIGCAVGPSAHCDTTQ